MWGPRGGPHDAAAHTLRDLVRLGTPPLPWVASVITTLILIALLGTLPPLLTGRIIDALRTLDASAALRAVALLAAATLAAGIASLVNTYSSAALRESVARALRVSLMGKLFRARLDDIERMTLAQIANRINVDIDDLCTRIEFGLVPLLRDTLSLLAIAVTMLAMDVRFALIAFVATALAIVPTKIVVGPYGALKQDEANLQDQLAGLLNESATLSALALLRNVRAAARELARYGVLADRTYAVRLRSTLYGGIAGLATCVLNLIGPVAVLAMGTYLMLHHAASLGTIVTILMYQSRLYSQFSGLSALPLQLAGLRVIGKRVLEVAALEDETGGNLPFVPGEIEVRGATVTRGGFRAVTGAEFTIARGARAAFVGPSGSGKSTLALLFARLSDPSDGCVTIGGVDLRAIEPAHLRNAVALVSQDPLVFDTTLRENLTYTNPHATDTEIERALRICRLEGLVARLEHGLETRAGQRGFRLSGGERQRICVARALISQPEILVLDEALTGVDLETEAAIVADLDRALAGRTLVVVTHRLSSVRNFDPIVVVEGGRVVAHGPHERVCAASPWYRELSREAALA